MHGLLPIDLYYDSIGCDMQRNDLPTVEQAYNLLCAQGDQFGKRPSASLLEGLSYEHPSKGQRDITIDGQVLSIARLVYAGDPALGHALQQQGVHTAPLSDAISLFAQHFVSDSTVWGFSGYATPGHNYGVEARGMAALYDHLVAIGEKPGLTIDGGVSAGILGLNGVLAQAYGVASLGFIPLQGLASVGTRDYVVVKGNTYADREELVGVTPDILCVWGGADGARRECQATLRNGGVALIVALKDYGSASLPSTYHQFAEMQSAMSEGRLIVCRTLKDIPACVDAVLEVSALARSRNRSVRLLNIIGLLLAI